MSFTEWLREFRRLTSNRPLSIYGGRKGLMGDFENGESPAECAAYWARGYGPGNGCVTASQIDAWGNALLPMSTTDMATGASRFNSEAFAAMAR